MTDISGLFAHRAELLRDLASLDEAIGGALAQTLRPEPKADDALTLPAAAALMGEPAETFRRRPDYRKALLSRPGERRLRYDRRELDRIKADRLAANGVAESVLRRR